MTIVGGVEDGKPFLIAYYSIEDQKILTQDNMVVAGGIGASLASGVIQTIENCLLNKISSEESLIMNLATLQGVSIHEQTFRNGVGGFFKGASISSGGIKWAKDTIHLLYSTYNFEKGDKHYVYRYN